MATGGMGDIRALSRDASMTRGLQRSMRGMGQRGSGATAQAPVAFPGGGDLSRQPSRNMSRALKRGFGRSSGKRSMGRKTSRY
jgi:hypothetical protein